MAARLARRRLPRLDPRLTISVVYVCSMFMSTLDSTIVNVALPTLGRAFGEPVSAIGIVVVAYLVSLAISIPASGWMGDRFGGARVLLSALAVFTAASAACGLAQTLPELVVFRVVQGLAGGMMTPVGMAMLYRVYPPHERIVVARRLMFATILAPATGPVLGGVLLSLLSWRFVFLVNVPVGLAALLFGLLFVRDRPQSAPGAFDVPGILLAGIGFGGVMFALSEGPSVGWSNPAIAIAAGLGIVLLAVLVAVELRTAEPLLNLRLLQNRLFRTVNTAALLSSTAFLGVLYLFTLYVQDGLGASPLVAGLTTFPEALGVVVSAQIVSRIYPWVGPRRMLSFGLLLVSIWIGAMALTGPGTNLWVLRGLMLLLGASIANVFVPSQAAAFATITREDTGRASTLFNSQRQIGAALGVAVLGTTLGILGPTEPNGHSVSPHLLAYHVAFVVAASIALLGAVLAQLIPDQDAAPTLRRRAAEASEAEG